MANKMDEKVVPMNDEIEMETTEMENMTEETGKVVDLRTEGKKGGFLRDLGIGAKIGVGLAFAGIGVGVGFLVKSLIGGRGEDAPIEAEGTVSEPVEG